MQDKYLSVFIPIFNEEENIGRLYSELNSVLKGMGVPYEIVFIDDHSTDSSYKLMRDIAAGDNTVKLVHFKRNYGQTAAMQAGFEYSSGKVIVSMDGDLQNDPGDIPALVKKIEEGFDVVCGWRKNRKDRLLSRRVPSVLANRLISRITGLKLNDYGCTLRAYTFEIAKAMYLHGDMHRFIPAFAFWEGASVAEIAVNHRQRVAGKSKYGISRTYKVILDLLTIKLISDYSTKPSHFFGGIGLVLCCASFLAVMVAAAKKIFLGVFMHKDPLILLAVMLFLLGVFFILMGLLAEMVVRIYYRSQNKSIFHVKDKINF
ncbi:MAG: glycosyltransferase family 2 protein [Candidatus Omnitrophota bacterium]|nr:glycosyltransferase family 2 protein [Candidatus Omnitrophota bacterium]